MHGRRWSNLLVALVLPVLLAVVGNAAHAQGAAAAQDVPRHRPSIGLALSAVALILFARLPVDGHYATDLLPAFLLSGIGLAMAFWA